MFSGFKHFVFVLSLFNLLFISDLNAQQFKNEQELRKEADKLFEDDEFFKAYPLFTQLVSLYPKDPELNYKVGVCMLFTEADKKKCFSYLKLAATHPKDAPKDAKFYYAKAYHMNYMFDEALNLYKEYKNIGSPAQQKRLQVDKEIAACVNGKRLLSNMSDLVVMNKKQLNEADYFRSYDLATIGGKLLVKPDQFRTSYDKKKKEKSVIYLPKSGDKIFFSSYGDNGETGRDIYYSVKVSADKFSKPVKLPSINTEYDEDYPFLHPDGRTLYFSSKGFNSMGGYDIFKSVYNEETNTWSTPVNLEFPINSPDDDYLFVTDSSEKYAYFSTGRQSPPGKIDVLKVKTERMPMMVSVIKGTVLKEDARQSVQSKITVKNMENGQVVGVFQAKDNGDYKMEVPNGGKLLFTVETPGLPVQSDKVILPLATSFSPFKQAISYDNKVLRIINYFDSPPDDNNYLQYIDLIEKKAKLDVNENEFKNAPVTQPLATTGNNPKAVNTTNPSINPPKNNETTKPGENVNIQAANTNTSVTKPNYSNDQLVQIAKEDAKEAQTEANKFNQDAADAKELAEQKKIESDKLSKQAKEANDYAISLTDPVKKENATEEATKIKNDAEEASKVSTMLQNYSTALQHDATNKQKEADLNTQYVKEIENAAKNKNSKDALTKLDQLQKDIQNVASKSNESEKVYSEIKAEYDQKQSEIANAEKKSNAIKNEITEINKEININETEIANTKDKSLKKTLTAQVDELKNDLSKKKTELEASEKLVADAKENAKASDTGMYLTNQVKTTDSKTAVAVAIPTNTTAVSTETSTPFKISAESLASKYSEKLSPVNENPTKENLQASNVILSDYNKEITNLIVSDNNKLKTAKTDAEKTSIKNEIAQLQKQKEENIQLITSNNTKLKETEVPIATTTNTGTAQPTLAVTSGTTSEVKSKPISVFDGKDELTALSNLKSGLNDKNSAFDYNGYQETASVSLKKEAENKLAKANESKLSLDSSITKAESTIQSNQGKPTGAALKDQLNNEGDALSNKAKDTRNLANSKKGAEKDKLLAEAKQYDSDANKKYLEASEVNRKLNKSTYDLNNQNITELVNQAVYFNKNTPENTANLNEGQKLQAEAANYLKQAVAMREEANNLGSDAAKLGTISNAEEKEAEAIAKQEKALAALLKSNPGYAVKKADFAENPNAGVIADVKKKYIQLNKDKLDAYMTLSKANQNEYKAKNNKLGVNPAIKNNSNPEAIKLKKEAEAANNQAIALISKALTEQESVSKQNLMMEANKKEVEALELLAKADELLSGAVAVHNKTEKEEPIKVNKTEKENNVVITEVKPATSETVTAITTKTTNAESVKPISTETKPVTTESVAVAETKTTTTGQSKEIKNETKPVTTESVAVTETKNQEKEKPVTTETKANKESKSDTPVSTKTETKTVVASVNTASINPEYKTVKDTAVKSLISYIDNNAVPYKNVEATSIKSNAVNNLIALADEQAKTEEEIKKTPGFETSVPDAKTNIEKLNTEADNYDTQASAKRKEANTKTGAEKEQLISEITDLENKSYAVKLKAGEMQKSLNEAQFNYNAKAIENYISKAKAADAPETTQTQDMLIQITNSKKQAGNMRDEANSITNNSAKLGALSNAEEKETELLAKQNEIIGMLRKYDLSYSQPALVVATNPEANISPELKQKYESVLLKQNTELENISKANVMEYETINEQLPVILNEKQKQNKANADKLITSSKLLNDQANKTNDLKLKKELLKQAGKQGQEAIVTLNKVYEKDLIAKNTKPVKEKPVKEVKEKPVKEVKEKPVKETSEPVAVIKTKTEPAIKENVASGENQVDLNVKGLEIKTGTPYSASNPIPLDAKIPDGLVFRVQVGAFKSPIPNNTFKGLTPVNAQTTPNGFIRYTVGNFEKFEDATGVKNDLRKMGYSDAFVVVYYNGQRITINEAINIAQKDGKEVIVASNQSAGIPTNANIAKNIAPAIPKNEYVVVTKELEKLNGLLFTVQIGVYSREITRSQLWKLEPIYTEKLPTGLYRYTAGIYSDDIRVVADKKKVVDLGIKDAFVSAYYNGKRVPFTEGQKIKSENQNLKMEPENPIVFPGENTGGLPPSVNNTPAEPTPTVQPFKNNVATAPAPTADNGVKVGEEGVSFKVQIGAYRNQVPNDVASKFLSIKTWPIENRFVNGLYIYTVGNFTDAKFAKQLRDEVVSLGITDAFISVYQNGKKLYGQEATNYLNR